MKKIFKNKFLIHTLICVFVLTQNSKAQFNFNNLVWYDEFNCTTTTLPDTTKWSYDVGNGCPKICGWGNNEKQFYTNSRKENVTVENGILSIIAKKEEYSDAKYTSARLVTKNKGDWKYGRMVIRAKIPFGRGIWPAIWMLPTKWEYGDWPHSGEIDIMENVGYWPDTLFGTVHTGSFNGMKNTQKSGSIYVKSLAADFHEYAIEWTRDEVSFWIDGKKYHHFNNNHTNTEDWPFDKEFHLLLNIAVGGNWGGKFGVDDGIFPQKMEIDYIRVYQ